ncbi:MAG: RNA polymerase sigma factor [Solirubrobacteraceae bacterium]
MLLGRLASARAGGDRAGTIGAIEALLCPLWPRVRAQAAAALRASPAQEGDLDDIAVATMMRLLAALGSERGLKVPFRVLVTRSVEFEVRDFRRARVQRARHEELREPAEMPERSARAAPSAAEQADALEAMLAPLSRRDRQVVIEREVLDLPVALVASRQRMSPEGVRVACFRAQARLRRAAEDRGVGFRCAYQ